LRKYLRQGGFFKCGHPNFLLQKLETSKIIVCTARKRGEKEVKAVRIFFGQGGQFL